MNIFDLSLEPKVEMEAMDAIARVVASKSFILGNEGRQFEQEFAAYLGVAHVVCVNSGTDALFLALKALGIGKGHEVITTPFTFVATAEAVVNCGAKPVFADIGSDYLLDPHEVLKRITKKTRAVLPVHLFGRMARGYDFGLPVVGDGAQCLEMGEGIATTFSFFPTKQLGGFGDGGAVATNDAKMASMIRSLRNHGSREGDKYEYERIGYSSRLDEIQAAVLRVKLRHKAFGKPLYTHTEEFAERDASKRLLEAGGIPTAVYYPKPLHLQKAFRFLGHKAGDFPHAERASEHILTHGRG